MRDKQKQADAKRKYYLENIEDVKAKARQKTVKDRIRNRDHIRKYLETHPCIDCGESDPIVLEFDHITDDKMHDISHMVTQCFSLKKIDEEIAKCEVRCANCHRRITHKRRQDSLIA